MQSSHQEFRYRGCPLRISKNSVVNDACCQVTSFYGRVRIVTHQKFDPIRRMAAEQKCCANRSDESIVLFGDFRNRTVKNTLVIRAV